MRWILFVALVACTQTEPKPKPKSAPEPVVAAPAFPAATELPPKVEAKPRKQDIIDTKLPAKALNGHEVGESVTVSRRLHRQIQPYESGQAKVLELTPGLHGTIVGFASRQVAGTALDVALVKWDAQRWNAALAAPIDRVKDGVSYGAAELNAMNAETGDAIDEPSFTAGLFFEELN